MDGITVGGHRVEDAAQVENTARAWKELLRRVKGETFDLTATTACELHALAAREEALEWGSFRTGPCQDRRDRHGAAASRNATCAVRGRHGLP